MIDFKRHILPNGLKLLIHRDTSTPMVAVNVLYDVGARDENPEQTGFAHLFEHLMFGGSAHIPSYDEPLQLAGGENNAYTTSDITNYYLQLPCANLETALWLESDRMYSLAFSPKSLEVQRKVVCEEFKEHYINKPYGDAPAHLYRLAYQVHPYQWLTIGKELKHIEDATLDDVKAFFKKHYCPNRAILCVAGNVEPEKVLARVEHWFGSIAKGPDYHRQLPAEPQQHAPRTETVYADVPVDALYKAWHIDSRLGDGFYAADILSDILGTGHTSRIHAALVKERQIFSSFSCYNNGSLDPGLIVFSGKLANGITITEADAALEEVLENIKNEVISYEELDKCINRVESLMAFEDMGLLSRANNLAYYELLGDANLMNTEFDRYKAVTPAFLQQTAQKVFDKNNCSTLYYLKK